TPLVGLTACMLAPLEWDCRGKAHCQSRSIDCPHRHPQRERHRRTATARLLPARFLGRSWESGTFINHLFVPLPITRVIITCSQGKNRKNGRRRPVTWSRIVPRSIG